MSECKLDVLMITYNHENYIEEAINGVVKQVTNFNYRLLIFDDCSTDNTEERIKSAIKHNNPNLTIEYHRNFENLGMLLNGKQSFEAISSTYTALCEGDDYWTDSLKLQKQVDFLEKNLDYSICFTNIRYLKNNELIDSGIDSIIGGSIGHSSNIHGYLNPYLYQTSSCVFRNIINFKKIKKIKFFKDIFLFSMALEYGDLYLMNEITAVYRIHKGGIWSMKSEFHNLVDNKNTFGEMVKYHKYKIPSFNESYLWSLIQIFYSSEARLNQKIGVIFNFLGVCFRKPHYFKLFKKDFLRIS